jgi:hypothetical protein
MLELALSFSLADAGARERAETEAAVGAMIEAIDPRA